MIPLTRCIIITSYHSTKWDDYFSFLQDDFIICADGGYRYAKAAGIKPHILIGDFDSIDRDSIKIDLDFDRKTDFDSGLKTVRNNDTGDICNFIRLPVEKDDTDTLYCLNYGINKGFDEFVILGGLGGRLDHTIANLQTMSHAVDQKKTVWIIDGKNKATLINPGSLTIKKEEGNMISLLSFTDVCEGVTITGVKYPLHEHRLTHNFPLGVSNEFMDDEATVSLKSGKLLIILTQD